MLRLYVLFMGDYGQAAPWSDDSVRGCKRFADRVWSLLDIVTDEQDYSSAMRSSMHKAVKKVSEDIETMKFNTAIAALMSLLNDITSRGSITKGELKTFITLLYPFAPHMTEEMWQVLGFEGHLSSSEWPDFDPALCVDDEIEIAVQVNGKLRSRINVAADVDSDGAIAAANADEKVRSAIEGKTVVKEIYVKGKLVNIVVK